MLTKKNLYFLAILPDPITSQRVADIKEDIFNQYGYSYGQRLPAHITLQSPFILPDEGNEIKLRRILFELAGKWKPFRLKVCNFDSIENRVLTLDVCHSIDLNAFQAELTSLLEKRAGVPLTQLSLQFNPHITLAHRDIPAEEFDALWDEYKSRKFDASFEVHHLVLFKHDETEWQLLDAVKLEKKKEKLKVRA
ncbi:MAG: 2'-5' RNA ligase family protein [Bacteroidetes bacterium]|nr:MAG: 2'-5' RNA ligase family protein [Bacteroidota bacterium]